MGVLEIRLGRSAHFPLPGSKHLLRRPRLFYVPMLVCLLTGIILPGAWPAEPQPVHKLSATFVFRFAQFVQWPDSAFESSTSPIRVGILGNDLIAEVLRGIAASKKAGNRPLKVMSGDRFEDVATCHVIFVDVSKEKAIADILEGFEDASILSVSDMKNFARRGGVIHLFQKNNKMRMEINVDAARRAHLTISSKLLALATVVEDDKRTGD